MTYFYLIVSISTESSSAHVEERDRALSRAFRNTQALGSRMLIVYYANMKIFLLYMRNVIFIFIIIIIIKK